MDAYLVGDNLVQRGVRVNKGLRRAATPRRCRIPFSFTPYTSIVSLLILSCHLCNVGLAEGANQDNNTLSATSATARMLGRRDAIKKTNAVLPQAIHKFPQTCPVCNCSDSAHHAYPSHEDATTQTTFQPSQPAPNATAQVPASTFVAVPDTSLQIDTQYTERTDRSTSGNTAWNPLPKAPPHTGFSSGTFEEKASLPGFTKWSGDEHKDEGNSTYDDGDDDSGVPGAQAAPEWFFKTGRGGGKRTRNIEKHFNQWLRKRFGKKYDPSTCKKLRREGRHPSAALRHSPIELFGYPVFDERSGRTFLERRLPLSIVQGYLVPIRVGAEDYVIQGTFDQISAFLECFEDYQAIASKLQPDGHWSADAEHGALFLQVQNTVQDLESPFDNSKILFRWGFDRVIRIVASARSIKNLSDINGYDEIMEILDNVEDVADFLPHITREELFAFWDELVQLPTIPERLKLVCAFLERSFSRSRIGKTSRWSEDGALNLRRPLTLTLTSYPKPSHGVRATYPMDSNVATLREIKEALSTLFQNSTMAYALREANQSEQEQENP